MNHPPLGFFFFRGNACANEPLPPPPCVKPSRQPEDKLSQSCECTRRHNGDPGTNASFRDRYWQYEISAASGSGTDRTPVFLKYRNASASVLKDPS